MATEFKLPELGEDIESGDVINVLVSVGDSVVEEQPVMEIETDKATIEVPAPVGGSVKEIHVKEGDKVKVGQLLFTIDEEGGNSGEKENAEEGAEGRGKVEKEEEKEEKKDAKVNVKEEKKQEKARKKEAKAEEERARGEAKEEVVEGEGGRETETEAKEGRKEKEERTETRQEKEEAEDDEDETEKNGEESGQKQGKVVELSRRDKTVAESEPSGEPVPAAPSVRRLARELGVEIDEVPGSGPAGRISESDVKNFARWIITKGVSSESNVQSPAASASPQLPDFTKWGEVEREPMTGIRRKTAEVMSFAWTTVPHVTQHEKADITNLEKLRKEFGKKAEEAGRKLTVTAIIIKVVASALKIFPQFNASVDIANEEVIYKKYCHIGVAVDTGYGLLVPVIRDADKKNIVEISVELTEISEKARNKKISLEEMRGGTFTVSNQGGIGSTYFTPIVYWPEVAILGVSRAVIEPVFGEGQFKPRLMLPLSLSHDHRIIDGADAVRFLRWITEALEEPFKLALEG